jgi:hypothetical protein
MAPSLHATTLRRAAHILGIEALRSRLGVSSCALQAWLAGMQEPPEEERRLVGIALTAFDAIKTGNVGVAGATGALLEDSLLKLRALIDRSLPEVRAGSGMVG